MLSRILRLLSTGISTYSFYTNPLRFIISLFCVLLIPYLAYIFWGTIVIVALAIAGLYFIYKALQSSLKDRTSYY